MQRGREYEREKDLLVGGTAQRERRKERRGPPTVAARGLKEVF